LVFVSSTLAAAAANVSWHIVRVDPGWPDKSSLGTFFLLRRSRQLSMLPSEQAGTVAQLEFNTIVLWQPWVDWQQPHMMMTMVKEEQTTFSFFICCLQLGKKWKKKKKKKKKRNVCNLLPCATDRNGPRVRGCSGVKWLSERK
jgi:hypothetical protein